MRVETMTCLERRSAEVCVPFRALDFVLHHLVGFANFSMNLSSDAIVASAGGRPWRCIFRLTFIVQLVQSSNSVLVGSSPKTLWDWALTALWTRDLSGRTTSSPCPSPWAAPSSRAMGTIPLAPIAVMLREVRKAVAELTAELAPIKTTKAVSEQRITFPRPRRSEWSPHQRHQPVGDEVERNR